MSARSERRPAARLALALALALATIGAAPAARADDDDTKKSAPEAPGRVLPQPDTYYSYRSPHGYPSLAWWATQLVPSPEIAAGRVAHTGVDGVRDESTAIAFGLRWQVTPVLWSWGTNRRISRWRFFVVDPLARHAGSIELDANLEYIWGHVDRMIVRPGVRAYFPLYGRGEALATSIGTSTYRYDGTMRVAYDVGLYTLSGIFGVQATFAPAHDPMSFIGTFRIRYF